MEAQPICLFDYPSVTHKCSHAADQCCLKLRWLCLPADIFVFLIQFAPKLAFAGHKTYIFLLYEAPIWNKKPSECALCE